MVTREAHISYIDGLRDGERLTYDHQGALIATTELLFRTYNVAHLGVTLRGKENTRNLDNYIVPLIFAYADLDPYGWEGSLRKLGPAVDARGALAAYYQYTAGYVDENRRIQPAPAIPPGGSIPCNVLLTPELLLGTELSHGQRLSFSLQFVQETKNSHVFLGKTIAASVLLPFRRRAEHWRPKVNGYDRKLERITRELTADKWISLMASAIIKLKDPGRFVREFHADTMMQLLSPEIEPPLIRI